MLPAAPDYGSGTLVSVLPAVARSLGSTRYATAPALGIGPARRAVVVLVDGLGYEQLVRRSGHAPFLRGHLGDALRLDSGFPSTTATSMGSFGTGAPPGVHGLVGYEVLDPDQDRVFNELSWEDGPDPFLWQPTPTVFQEVAAEGVEVIRIGPGFFDGSGLTNAALRGGRFRAASSLGDRVAVALEAVRSAPRTLVYLYWGDLDKVGHVHGPSSWEWVDELESIDRHLASLVAGVPDDTTVHVTADHGLIDVPYAHRVDLAAEPELSQGLRHIAWEPRATQLHVSPGAAESVAARWRDRMGDRAWVATRDELVTGGWFGSVRPEVLARIGDVLVIMLDDGAVVDTVRMRPELVRLRGFHGSVTDDERAIPFVTVPPRTA
ncbi:MAG: nucleotide pyrophosphatase/phosphodiesterase family protein [Lapillicoccus sp.]